MSNPGARGGKRGQHGKPRGAQSGRGSQGGQRQGGQRNRPRTGQGGGLRRQGGKPDKQYSGPAGRRGVTDQRIVGGLHPVRELLRSDHPVTRIVLSRTREPVLVLDEILALADERSVPVERHDPPVLDALSDGLVHQGVVALAPPFPYQDLDDVVAGAGDMPLLVALDSVTDPHNLGSIARTAEAAGAHGLLIPERRSASITPTAEKSAAGALAHLPVVQVGNLVRTLGQLHDVGIWSLGLDGDVEVELADHPLVTEPCVIVVGAEGDGLSRLTRERCDALVALPMHGQVGSLNASVAAAVAMYTVLDRRARA